MHQEVAALGGADQAGHRRLRFPKILLSLRQLHDVGGGILERDELATAGQRNRIVEGAFQSVFGGTVSAEFRRPPEPRRCVGGGHSCRPDRGCETSRRTGSPSNCSAFATAAVRRVPTSRIAYFFVV